MSRRGIEIPCQNKCGRLSSPPYRGGYFCDECAHAPETDTPATQPKMVDDPVNGLVRMRIVQAAKESAKRRGMKEPDIHCVYTAGVLLLAEAESTLAAERASRVQADTEQFNAGIEAAVQACDAQANLDDVSLTDEEEAWNHAVNACGNAVAELYKPSVSPEQEKP